MKTSLFSTGTGLDDLVFENRNKTYGAYDLRKTYDERLTLSAMATVSFFMLFFSAFYFFQPENVIPDITFKPSSGPEISGVIEPEYIENPERMFVKPIENAVIIPDIVKHKVDHKDLPKKIEKTEPGPTGDGKTGNPGGSGGIEKGTGKVTETILPPVYIPEKVDFTQYFDVAPKFDGYEAYLQNNIKYPERAVANNIQGTIFIMVKISETGKVAGVEIVKGIGGGCDEEAARVIKNMPDWVPGIQNGKPVPVKCVLRVKMLLQN